MCVYIVYFCSVFSPANRKNPIDQSISHSCSLSLSLRAQEWSDWALPPPPSPSPSRPSCLGSRRAWACFCASPSMPVSRSSSAPSRAAATPDAARSHPPRTQSRRNRNLLYTVVITSSTIIRSRYGLYNYRDV